MTITENTATGQTGEPDRSAVLQSLAIAAFGDADRITVAELVDRINATDPSFDLDAGGLKSALAAIGMTPYNGANGKRFYQRSAAVGPMPGGQQLLTALSAMAGSARDAAVRAEAVLVERRRAEQERRASLRVTEAADWWRRNFTVAGVEPPMLDWTGYPLPDGREPWGPQEPDRIHALAHLGNGAFLAYYSRAIGGIDYPSTEHTTLVVFACACACCHEHHEQQVSDMASLGDVLNRLADGTCPKCAPAGGEW
ncbi:MAG: hypothetical protein ACJ786_04165 [Catenulispora sp.]